MDPDGGRVRLPTAGGGAVNEAEPDIEGWYRDPYGLHEDRWMSAGRPTRLVRDGQVESDDAPPEGPFTRPIVRSSPHGADPGAADLRRADDDARADGDLDAEGIAEAGGAMPFPT